MTTKLSDIPGILDELEQRYASSADNLREALTAFVTKGTPPSCGTREEGCFAYPELRLEYRGQDDAEVPARAFARLNRPGSYASSIASPALFRSYLTEQLEHLVRDFPVTISVGTSSDEIPYPYLIGETGLDLGEVSPAELSRWFPTTELVSIGDELADGTFQADPDAPIPLSLFDALRTDFSLARLRHYTGTPAGHFQRYVLFTNYVRYVDEFVAYAVDELRREDSRFDSFSTPGAMFERGDLDGAVESIAAGAWRRHQMPAYHLTTPEGDGISLVNIGVGPSNAKTICDHIAVLRPEAWLMIGHCGGLRPSQTIGDYVLAHAYLRDDNVLDPVLPPEIPIPAIAEVQTAMFGAALDVTGESEDQLKKRLRTGTVVTTDDRNWELLFSYSARRFNQSRAVAVDMESATVAAQGYRFRVPYGTLLCVSDKPLHGEIKLPGPASSFYQRSIGQHLRIGIETLARLREEGDSLHSRKLRSFDEPPLR